MTGHVVDENVLRTANGEADHAGIECQLAAIDFLLSCSRERSLVLDDEYEILTLYARHCSHAGQPGVGDQFMVWARDNIATLRRERVSRAVEGGYAAVDAAGLHRFDRDDHIYLATALSCDPPARLVNAIDSDYAEHGGVLLEAGLEVEELCPQALHRPGRGRRTS